jgi:hypothetical protein
MIADKVPIQSLPWLEFDVRAGGRHHRFHREVLFLQAMEAPYQSPPPSLDGRLGDWAGVRPLRLGEGSKPAAELRAVHDEDSLSLAITLPVKSASDEEESAFRDDLQIGIAGRLGETEFGSDLVRLGFACGERAAEVKDRTPGSDAAGMVPGVKCVCRTEGERTTYEIRIPLRLLRGLRTGAGRPLILNLSFPVPDGETVEPAEPEPNSLSYQVRYGGDSLVPVHFVELFLERKEPSSGREPPGRSVRPPGR